MISELPFNVSNAVSFLSASFVSDIPSFKVLSVACKRVYSHFRFLRDILLSTASSRYEASDIAWTPCNAWGPKYPTKLK